MGRKKSYDREQAAERALQTFWERGYHQTSLKDLERSTGVNRYGLYDSFRDKEGLFAECLDRYRETVREMLDEHSRRGLDGLIDLVRRFAEPDDEDPTCRNGCLIVTSMLEREGYSEALRQRLDEHIETMLDSIRRLLEAERGAGHLRDDLDIEECVEFVHLALIGLPTMSRIASDDARTRLAARMTMRTIESWRS